MVKRGLSREDKRIIEARQSNLKALSDGFKSMMERGKKPAPQGLREDAFTGMWNFARVRQQVSEEVRSLELYICHIGPGPDDRVFNERIARLCLALYFLDRMEQISRAVQKDGGLEKVALFSVAREGVEAILDGDFFAKSPRRIIGEYLDAEYSLAPLASACSVRLLPLDEAILNYQGKAASLVEEAERTRQAADALR